MQSTESHLHLHSVFLACACLNLAPKPDDTLALAKLGSRGRRRLISYDDLAASGTAVMTQIQLQGCTFENVCTQAVVSARVRGDERASEGRRDVRSH